MEQRKSTIRELFLRVLEEVRKDIREEEEDGTTKSVD